MKFSNPIAAILLCAGASISAERSFAADDLTSQLADREAGRPVSCIPFSRLGASEINGEQIIFRSPTSRTIYVNSPSTGGEALRRDVILVVRTPSSSLCRSDIVRLIDRGSRIESGAVTLGEFVPWTRRAVQNR